MARQKEHLLARLAQVTGLLLERGAQTATLQNQAIARQEIMRPKAAQGARLVPRDSTLVKKARSNVSSAAKENLQTAMCTSTPSMKEEPAGELNLKHTEVTTEPRA